MRAGLWLLLVVGAASGCNSDATGESCTGQARYLCVAGCGSDYIQLEVCRDGTWTCPEHTIRGDMDCPPGTCFNNPNYTTCCNANGEKTLKICAPTPGSLPYAGVCPSGYVSCDLMTDGGADAALDAAPDDAG